MTEASVRFDQIAQNFATSEVHRDSPTIRRLQAIVDLPRDAAVCDIACGAGHLGLSFAGRAGRITAVDPAPSMLESVRRLARERGIDVEVVKAVAEEVPLPSHSFDLVMSRLAPHHFRDIAGAIHEMARLVKPGGLVAVIDLEGHDDPLIDEFNHLLEVFHDPTHVRSYRRSSWQALFEAAGLRVDTVEGNLSERPQGLSITRWCEIAASGTAAEGAIRRSLHDAPAHTLTQLGIWRANDEYFIPVRTVLIVGHKERIG
jgi:ubiquinone/menaquinone biosynthesis C-methylase UbiE